MEIEKFENKILAEEYKAKGNDDFKKKDYLQAIENYSKAIGNNIILNQKIMMKMQFTILIEQHASLL